MSDETYDPAFFDALDRAEDRHFWFRARRRVVEALARSAARSAAADAPRDARLNVLEIGCGNGRLLPVLRRACAGARVVGMDLYAEALRHARRSGCPVVRGDVHRPPFARAFHVVGLFDVIEHLDDDLRALRDARELLAPGGRLLLTVPAWPSLWSYFDDASRHRRRYTPATLREALAASGYRVEYATQFMAALFPLVWAGRRVASLRARSRRGEPAVDARQLALRELRVVPVLNGVLAGALAAEASLVTRRRVLPIGTSIAAVATPR
jgi:SAM-dependent methyltransferase